MTAEIDTFVVRRVEFVHRVASAPPDDAEPVVAATSAAAAQA